MDGIRFVSFRSLATKRDWFCVFVCFDYLIVYLFVCLMDSVSEPRDWGWEGGGQE